MTYYPLSIAPMMQYTHRHGRYLLRLCHSKALLYTEMLSIQTLEHRDPKALLAYHPNEAPLALQLGGSDPALLSKYSQMAETLGYAEVNLNVGCPSTKVQNGGIGACLFKTPKIVARCVAAMQKHVNIPITVKTRLGVDDFDQWSHLQDFIETVADAGCETFIIHARKAWLKGLNPRQNRSKPPLDYEKVQRLVDCYPKLNFVLNGGLQSSADFFNYSPQFHGLMFGRAAINYPFMLQEIEQAQAKQQGIPFQAKSRAEILQQYIDYLIPFLTQGESLCRMLKPIIPLAHGLLAAKSWRQQLLQPQSSQLQSLIQHFQVCQRQLETMEHSSS
jgi:tRNA-dihydrouridine synthase A